MKLSDLFRLLRKNILVLVLFPALLAGLVFYFTMDEEKEYRSSFLVYTGIASGYDITTEEHPRLDHNAVNNAFDNLLTTLKARETIEEVGVRLLATHLRLEKPDDRYISPKNFNRVRELIPDDIEKKIRDAKTFDDAITVIYEYKYGAGHNAIKAMLNSSYELYGIDLISSRMTANRKSLSDMLEVSYTANDPAICQQTLQVLSEVFIRRYKELKSGEITRVVNYFTDQTRKSQEKLKEAEDRIKEFEIKNKIINFGEQTKNISEAKQHLIESIQQEKMTLSSAQATVKNLESRLKMRKGVMETNEKILAKRQQLANLNYKIANAHMYDEKSPELTRIKQEAEEVKEEIRGIVNELYQVNNSAEGMPQADLIAQWLSNVLLVDETSARLKIMEARFKEFDSLYDQYAPLAASINRMKREVELAEKEYFEQLNAFNMNKQRQQNIEISNNVKIVDNPYYPLEPESSNRPVLIAGSFFAGFSLIFGFLFTIDFFDNKIKTPARAEQITGLKLAGVMPTINEKEKKYDLEYLEASLMEQAISSIILEITERGGVSHGTKLIMVSSTKAREGKTWCAYKLASKLSEIKGKVLFMYPEAVSKKVSDMAEHRLHEPSLELKGYETGKDFVNKASLHELAELGEEKLSKYSFVLIEIPALSEKQLPIELVKKMDISLLVLRADRTWTETDNYVSRMYRKACHCEPMLFLNRVSFDGLKEVFGEIPGRKKTTTEHVISRKIKQTSGKTL
jgi:polysaccharide biosynthesis transport protein